MFKIFQDLVIFTFALWSGSISRPEAKIPSFALISTVKPSSLDSSVGRAVDSSARGPGFKSSQEHFWFLSFLILDSVVVRITPVERETGVQFPAGEEFLFDPQNWSKFKSKTSFELRRTSQIQFWHSQTSPMPLRSENLLRITPIFIKICDFWPIFFIFLLKPPFFYAFSEDSVKVRPEFHAGLG